MMAAGKVPGQGIEAARWEVTYTLLIAGTGRD